MSASKRWVLAKRPEGVPCTDDFRLEDMTLPEIQDGQALIRVDHISVDPGMRSRLSGDSYAPALDIGATIESAGIGRVIASKSPKLKEGSLVWGGFGWQTHFVSDGRGVQALDPELYKGKITPTSAIGMFGIPGLTAFFGMFEVGKLRSGSTVLISSAAGTVGATAGQIAKIIGMHGGGPRRLGRQMRLPEGDRIRRCPQLPDLWRPHRSVQGGSTQGL
jgi:NADPH-dependent curcumin reductase CurA